MSYSNVDPMLVQLLNQILFLQKQIVYQSPEGIAVIAFIDALENFIDVVGKELQRQAE